jgi:indole-3-glycerol phosphate synthase
VTAATTSTASDLLGAIVAAARRRVEVAEQMVPLGDLISRVGDVDRGAAFSAALTGNGINVVAECKRRSPSRGILREEYDAAAIARSYEAAGARAVSVLTEPAFFDGSLADLERVVARTSLPALRKDFTVAPYQVYEAAAAGASAVLFIVAALERDELVRLMDAARDARVAALVEVHTREELDRALDAGAAIVGVNNRDLRNMKVSIETSLRLAQHIPAGVVKVAESGLRTGPDLASLRSAGYDAFLIGEAFMTSPDPGAELMAMIDRATAAGR